MIDNNNLQNKTTTKKTVDSPKDTPRWLDGVGDKRLTY